MWKLILAFIVFAAVALVVLKQAGGNIDMGGEKHGMDAQHAEPAASAAAPVAPPAAASAAVLTPAPAPAVAEQPAVAGSATAKQ